MATQETQQRNFLDEYVAIAKERCDKARRKNFCRYSVEYFEDMAVVLVMVAERVQVTCFVEEHLNSYWPIYSYWMTPERRRPLVARMYKQGMSGVKIAQFLKVASSTIYKDLQFMRQAHTYNPATRVDLSKHALRESKIVPEHEFKQAADDFFFHLQELGKVFGQHSTTMQ